MRRDIRPRIDSGLCTRCGACVEICASELLVMGEDGPEATGRGPCFFCGHCVAVCPENAVQLPDTTPSQFKDLLHPEQAAGVDSVWDLLRRRRSVRRYRDEALPEDIIRRIITAGTLAPSALNEQAWHFTVLSDPERLLRIRRRIVAIFRSLLKMLEGRVNRMMLRVMLGSETADMLMEMQPMVERLVEAYDEQQDCILWDAPTLIVVHSAGDDTAVIESSHYAVGNMMMMATAMGLGTCLVGFVTEAAERDSRLKEYLKVPPDHSVDASLVIGYPAVEFLRSTHRMDPPVEFD